jgi:hypothetical protein
MHNARVQSAVICLTIASIVSFGLPAATKAATASDRFVRISNNYMKAGITLPSSDYAKLAAYDVLVLPAEAQIFNPDFFPTVRRLNPDIVILAYIPTKSYAQVWSDNPLDTLHPKLKARTDDSMRLREPGGKILSVWPGTLSYNVNSGWADALPRFVKDDIMSSGAWDGIFYDETSATISWLNGGNVDVDNDGARDDAATADRLWEAGMIKILKTTRELLGPGAVIVTNGDSDPDLQPYVNGRMFETFPTPWEYDGTWATVMNNYLRLQKQVGYPAVFLINSNTGNTGAQNDFRKMRFGLTSTLMGDGFFQFDYGDTDHGQTWMYDEYGAYLGKPLGEARNLTGSTTPVQSGVWRRDFQNGTVLVNSTNESKTVDLDADFERMHGTQDPVVNNGEISSVVTIPPQDGVLLLRPLERVSEASYKNGAFTRVLTNTGAVHRNGFFAYDERYRGGLDLAEFQPAGAKETMTIVAKGNRLELYDTQNRLVRSVAPFGESWTRGMTFGFGKAGGVPYVAVGAGQGGAPYVRMYTEDLEPVTDAFLAYDSRFLGGVNVAVGDLNGDGSPDLTAGAGPGGGPHVRVFNKDKAVMAQFFAYDQRFRGGVYVAMGDVDGDKAQEIVTGPGFGGGPHVRVWNALGQVENQFFAFDSAKRGGARVSVGDTDGDGRYEILAMTNDAFTLALGFRNLF